MEIRGKHVPSIRFAPATPNHDHLDRVYRENWMTLMLMERNDTRYLVGLALGDSANGRMFDRLSSSEQMTVILYTMGFGSDFQPLER